MTDHIRNFVIIAHVDHGKSTLADRFLELTGTVTQNKLVEQMLDLNPIERERGMTIKMQPVRMVWKPDHAEILSSQLESQNKPRIQGPNQPFAPTDRLEIKNSNSGFSNSEFILNLIDTPGHVDFYYEVERALACVEGAILLVDATKGVQAQTLASYDLAKRANLTIIPVVNKIDLTQANPDQAASEISRLISATSQISFVSAKTGQGCRQLLKRVIEEIPSPKSGSDQIARALVFDSLFDPHRGVIAHTRVFDGSYRAGDSIMLMAKTSRAKAVEVGFFSPARTPSTELKSGEIGYIVTDQKYIRNVRIGDTVTKVQLSKPKAQKKETQEYIKALPGYQPPNILVWASIFPSSPSDSPLLQKSLEKLQLNDASLSVEPEHSLALGPGFRIGALGLLHLDIIRERLEREYGQSVIVTTPSVAYQIVTRSGKVLTITGVPEFPDQSTIAQISEPIVSARILVPAQFLGRVFELIQSHRGVVKDQSRLGPNRVELTVELPLAQIVINFNDQLKSISSGFGSVSYRPIGQRTSDLVKLDIIVANELVSPLARIVHRSQLEVLARQSVSRLKQLLHRQNFEFRIQAVLGGKVLASERIAPLRKDVTAKLYGGDVTRKRKLLDKQKAGKKRLRQFGSVAIPPEVFAVVARH